MLYIINLMSWKGIPKTFDYQERNRAGVGFLLVIGLLLLAPKVRAQGVTIEGRVVLEHSQKPVVQTSLGGYQNSPQGSSFSEKADSSSNDIVLWLEAADQNETYQQGDDARRVLDQKDKQFVPRLMVIRKGTEVRIHNSDPVYHNVFSLSKAKRFDVGRRSPGEYQDVRFDKAGKVDVFCDIHSDMHAVIIVAPQTTVAMQKLTKEGSFRFTDVPQGQYILHLYALGDRRRTMNIQTTNAQKITLKTIRLGS